MDSGFKPFEAIQTLTDRLNEYKKDFKILEQVKQIMKDSRVQMSEKFHNTRQINKIKRDSYDLIYRYLVNEGVL